MASPVPAPVSRRVAIVDDSQAVRLSLSLLLRNRGYDVDVFEGGGELLAALDARPFDIFVIDLKLEDTDGATLLKELRGRGVSAPAILITGWEARVADQQAAQAGFDAFVRKPMLETSIVDEVRRLAGDPG